MGANVVTRPRRAHWRAGAGGRRYRGHALALPDGGKLRLHADGTIQHLGADGSAVASWVPSDPEWAGQAIRFGLRPEPVTVAPQGQRISDNPLP